MRARSSWCYRNVLDTGFQPAINHAWVQISNGREQSPFEPSVLEGNLQRKFSRKGKASPLEAIGGSERCVLRLSGTTGLKDTSKSHKPIKSQYFSGVPISPLLGI